jgi:hypothetical protein
MLKTIIVALSILSTYARPPPPPPPFSFPQRAPPARSRQIINTTNLTFFDGDSDSHDFSDIVFGNNSASFLFRCQRCGNVIIEQQNISFVGETNVDEMHVGTHSHVYINNATFFQRLDVEHGAQVHLKHCTIHSKLPMNITGNIDISDKVLISDSTLILCPSSSISNNGTLVLVNNSQIVISPETTTLLMNNISSDATSTYVIINGTLQTTTDIFVNSSVIINPSAQLFVSSSLLTVSDVTVQGTINVNQNATLVVQDALLMHTQLHKRRRLLQISDSPGVCVLQSVSGSGSLDCQMFVYDSIKTNGIINVASLKMFPKSTIFMNPYNQIISQSVIELQGKLVIDLTDFVNLTNFTILAGKIIGQFENHIFIGTSRQPTLMYDESSVSVQFPSTDSNGVVPSQNNMNKIIIPAVIGGFCVIAMVMYVMYRKNRHRRLNQQQHHVLVTDISDQGYINPLMARNGQ